MQSYSLFILMLTLDEVIQLKKATKNDSFLNVLYFEYYNLKIPPKATTV